MNLLLVATNTQAKEEKINVEEIENLMIHVCEINAFDYNIKKEDCYKIVSDKSKECAKGQLTIFSSEQLKYMDCTLPKPRIVFKKKYIK
jgi:hypothetical protein